MNELIQVGKLEGKHDQSNRIYSEDGIAPTIMAGERKNCTGGYVSPKIFTNTNKIIREIMLQKVNAENEGYKVYGYMSEPKLVGGIGKINFGKQFRQGNRVYDANEIAMCLMAQPVGNAGGFSYLYQVKNKGVENMWNNNLEKFNFKMEEIRVFDAFAGIGSLHKSLSKLGVSKRITNLAEVDIDAIISYSGVHIENFKDLEFKYPSDEYMRKWLMDRKIGYDFEKGKSKIPRLKKDKLDYLFKGSYLLNNLGDISSIDPNDIEDFDIFNLSFCCQDLSNAGKQKGLKNEDGTPTRSGLIVPSLKLARAKKPKYIMIENVKALIQKKFIDDFYDIINELMDMGYNCYYPTKEDKKGNEIPTCLNSKNFGIPQNRERIFVYAIRKDIDDGDFTFNYGDDMGIRLKDILEDRVDEKYYLSNEIQKRFKLNGKEDTEHNELNVVGSSAPECRTIGQRDMTYGVNGVMSTLTATDYKQPKQILDNNIPEYEKLKRTLDKLDDSGVTVCEQRSDKRVIENGAIRGRYNEEGKIEQQLELRNDGLTNTLTTVEKDNVLIENTNRVNRMGGVFDTGKSTHQAGSVYNDSCLSPTIDTMQVGYRQPCIQVIGKLECKGWHDIETRVYSEEGIAPTLETHNRGKYMDKSQYRIRKLTPLECWRLQGFDDEDFYHAQELGISDSALYKQAGNSITMNVLYYQFKNLFKKYIVKY